MLSRDALWLIHLPMFSLKEINFIWAAKSERLVRAALFIMLIAKDFSQVFGRIPSKKELQGDKVIENPFDEQFESDLEFAYMIWLVYFFDLKQNKELLRMNGSSISLIVQIFSRSKDIYVTYSTESSVTSRASHTSKATSTTTKTCTNLVAISSTQSALSES